MTVIKRLSQFYTNIPRHDSINNMHHIHIWSPHNVRQTLMYLITCSTSNENDRMLEFTGKIEIFKQNFENQEVKAYMNEQEWILTKRRGQTYQKEKLRQVD